MKNLKYIALTLTAGIALFSCKKEGPINGGAGLSDWTTETHSSSATPNYDIVFNQNEVQRIDFVIDADYWQLMQEDLAVVAGTGGGPGNFSDETPMYVPAQMFHDGKQWYDVGLRYKGNSSLNSAYNSGSGKLPLRVEMNHFEDENPNLSGQTFYGFQQLSFSSQYKDDSYLREKVGHDLFREFGVPAPRTAYYRIYVDYGDGPVYFGLYTLVEVVFDTMLDDQFGNNSGNCYKPDGDGARLNEPSMISSSYFINKTNDGAAFTDIETLVSTLLDDSRNSNPSQWRSDMDKAIDMDLYLKYLAANTVMRNWDTYGRMTHNYYLYNDPSKDKLVWVPWDNNETFSDGPGGGGGPGGGMSALDFDFSNISNNPLSSAGEDTWPMITYVYNDPVYKAQYDAYIDEFITTVFTTSNLTDKFNFYHNLIEQYVTGTDGEISGYTSLSSPSAFTSSVITLINYANQRIIDADAYTP